MGSFKLPLQEGGSPSTSLGDCAKQPPPLRGLEELGPGLAGDGEGPALTDKAQVMASGLPMRWCRFVPSGEGG